MALSDSRLFRDLRSLELPISDYAVAGSGPLFARGLIDGIGDLDVVARGPAWTKALTMGTVEEAPEAGVHRVVLLDGRIEVLDGWYPEVWDVDELIDQADVIESIPFVQLQVVVWTKGRSRRPKDREHLRRLAAAEAVRSPAQ